MDWVRLREQLKACRDAARLNQVALARAIGVNKSTINRIENVYGEPEHTPDLSTIERWVQATGLTLSTFFRQIEGLPITDTAGQDRTSPPASVSSTDETVLSLSLTDEERHTIRALTKIIRESADREHEAAQSLLLANRRHAAETHRLQTASPRKAGRDRSRDAGRRRMKNTRAK